MKIKKGDWFRCVKAYSHCFITGGYYQSQRDGFIKDEQGFDTDTFCSEFTKLYTIQDLKNGKAAMVNDGELSELRGVLSNAFKKGFKSSGNYRYYFKNDEIPDRWLPSTETTLPTQSVKDFLVQLPKEGAEQCSNNAQRNDPINPDHYKSYSVETIDMMVAIYGKEKTAIHCELTAFKYRQRLGKKDSLGQDLAKEKWYLEKSKELRNDNSVTKL